MKYPKLSNGCSQYGAQMGRRSTLQDVPCKLHLYRMPMEDGCYDNGGAYWGAGNFQIGWMYHAYDENAFPEDRDTHGEVFIRAKSREEAKEMILEDFPDARFYR